MFTSTFINTHFSLKSPEENRRGTIEENRLPKGRIVRIGSLISCEGLYFLINGRVKSACGMINTSRSGLPMCETAHSNACSMV